MIVKKSQWFPVVALWLGACGGGGGGGDVQPVVVDPTNNSGENPPSSGTGSSARTVVDLSDIETARYSYQATIWLARTTWSIANDQAQHWAELSTQGAEVVVPCDNGGTLSLKRLTSPLFAIDMVYDNCARSQGVRTGTIMVVDGLADMKFQEGNGYLEGKMTMAPVNSSGYASAGWLGGTDVIFRYGELDLQLKTPLFRSTVKADTAEHRVSFVSDEASAPVPFHYTGLGIDGSFQFANDESSPRSGSITIRKAEAFFKVWNVAASVDPAFANLFVDPDWTTTLGDETTTQVPWSEIVE